MPGDSADRFHPPVDVTVRAELRWAGSNRLVRILAAGVAAIVLIVLVVRFSVVNALMQVGPGAAALLVPNHSEAVLDDANDRLRLSGDLGPEVENEAMLAFDKVPLSEVPILIRARIALEEGDNAAADRLLEAVLRRNPRSRLALLLQLDRDVREGRTRQAAVNMATLTRLFSDVSDFLVAELARMATIPDSRPSVSRVMQSDPQMRELVLEQLARRGADPDTILELAGTQARGSAPTETPQWLGLMLQGMVARGEAAEARSLWLRMTGADPASRGGNIYDPGFAGLPGPPPFNWTLEMSADGFAERGSNQLEAEYYGRREARLASQLILLAPGRYQLSFEAEGQAEGDAGRLAWTVTCNPGDGRLAEVAITGVDFTPKRFAGNFTVPETGCASQWLRLVGTSAEFPKTQQVRIKGLQISGAGQP
jgi:hypothetical protein